MPRLPSHKDAARIAELASGKRKGVQFLPVNILTFDPVVNRDFKEPWAQRIADTFNPDAFGLILVNVRTGGRVVVIDGQHRTKAYLLMGWANQLIECEVFEGLTIEEEAALFVLRNTRRGMGHMETFLKLITAGNPTAVAINKIALAAGLCVHKQAGEGHITASAALEKVYGGARLVGTKENPKALADTLGTIVAAWGKESIALSGHLIHGIGLLYLRENGNIDKNVLATKLAMYPSGPTKLLGVAKGNANNHSRSVPFAVAGTIADLYNKGRHKRDSKLQSWWTE